MYAWVSMRLSCAGPSDCDDWCGVASAGDIKGGDLWLGWPNQILGLKLLPHDVTWQSCQMGVRWLRSMHTLSRMC